MSEHDYNSVSVSNIKVDLLVKFGGAAITDKSKLETIRPEALAAGAYMVKECLRSGQSVIVVHGAG